jgi:hypothetical protein
MVDTGRKLIDILDCLLVVGAGSSRIVFSDIETSKEFLNRNLSSFPRLSLGQLTELQAQTKLLDSLEIRKKFEEHVPGLLEKCIEFYLSRSEIRSALGYGAFALPNFELPEWCVDERN